MGKDALREQKYKLIEDYYRKNYKRLFKMCGNMMRNRAVGEEVVQEAFCRALQYWERIPDDVDMNKWMGRLIQNCSKDAYKAERSHGVVDYKEVEPQVQAPSAIPKIMLNEVIKLIEQKPENVRTILKLFLFEQQPPKDITQIVPETVNNIRVIIHRFRQELRKDYNWSF